MGQTTNWHTLVCKELITSPNQTKPFGFDAQKTLGSRSVLTGQATWSNLELVFDKGNFVNIWTGQLTLSYQF
jgi:hypothetical protein